MWEDLCDLWSKMKNQSRFSATELRLRLGGIGSVGTEGKLWSAVNLLVMTFLLKMLFFFTLFKV